MQHLKRITLLLSLFLLLCDSLSVLGQHTNINISLQQVPSLKASVDVPYLTGDKRLALDFHTALNDPRRQGTTHRRKTGKTPFALSLAFYKYDAKGDSILLCRKVSSALHQSLGAETHKVMIAAKAQGDTAWYLPKFYSILRKTGSVPPGNYKAYLSLKCIPQVERSNKKDSQTIAGSFVFSYQVDSTLSLFSPVRKDLNNTLAAEPKAGIGNRLFPSGLTSNHTSAAKAIERNTRKLDRLLKSRGLSHQIQKAGDKAYINLYYEDWFVGRYETEAAKSINTQVTGQRSQLAGGIPSTANSELEGYRSLLSQVKELNKQKKEDKELIGQIGVSSNWASEQPEYSAQDNNFYEVRANLETEIIDIPVSIEGYYTTQDAHRNIKSSYARVHYDAEKAKTKLLKLIGGFKSQYNNTAAKGKGLEQVYGSYLSNLKDNKSTLLNGLQKETGLSNPGTNSLKTEGLQARIKAALEAKMKDTAAQAANAEGMLDSAGKAKATITKALAQEARAKAINDSANHIYQRALKRYEQIEALEKKIAKYEGLIDQYKTTSYFDSALAYSKVQNLKSGDQSTYKQLAKSASGLLPEGKAKTFIAGLTSLDAGIFPKYVSKYTMAGQQLKGLDAGYDIGFAQVGITLGKTEYAGRDGTLDKYTTYGARAIFMPLKDQKIGLVYYGYTPSKSAFSSDNDFYKNLNIALPTFQSPVHIVSTTYEGTIAKNIHIESEAATSFRNATNQTLATGFDADRLAWHLNADGNIPKTALALTGSYEHGGKDFQNSTLPVIISGTDLYKAGLKGELLRGFISYGVEYNHMQQESFSSKGGNSRWGFNIATHSKQYPSLSFSYKPFETFRSAVDTLSIPQRPLLGAVWNGKASYQLKRHGGVSWRFTAVYNKSTSKSDSVSYGSDLTQVSVIYSTKTWMAMLSGGQTAMSTTGLPTDTLNPAHIRTTFATASGSYPLSKELNISGGTDIGFASYGLSKWGLNTGLSYRMKKVPLSIRMNGRVNAYRLPGYSGTVRADGSSWDSNTGASAQQEPLQWRRLYSGGIDLIWQLKMKLNK